MASFHQVRYEWAKQIADDMTHGACTVRILREEHGLWEPRPVSLWLRHTASGRVATVPLAGQDGDLADDPAREQRLRGLLNDAQTGFVVGHA